MKTPSLAAPRASWSAVGAMTMCVALLIASEFMPVSLLTPMAHDLGATEGMAGQAISISGLFAVITSLLVATVASRFDRRRVLAALTAAMVVSLALGVLYLGNAVATAFAAPIGSYLGGVIGWRGVFWALVPLAAATLAWQWVSLPSMPAQAAIPLKRVLGLLRRKNVTFAMLGLMLTFGGAFSTFTYLRPFLETQAHATLTQLRGAH